ncbi:MAG: type I toxin-antitoxin system SymE family toxin [Firmicutes bacterium]|nr:type I toxin-antitoxin system SymE family toxin [Bacillota bacterium]
METRVLTVTRAKSGRRRRPAIKLQGDWLEEIGFTAGELVAAKYEKGRIILQLQDFAQYRDLGKGELKPSSGLFQVRREKQYSQIDIKGFWLERFGFTIGGVIAARYEYGLIKLLLIDPEMFTE